MKKNIFHLGIKKPPFNINKEFSIQHVKVIDILFKFYNNRIEVEKFLKKKPIVLILSQNGVIGLRKWIKYYKYNICDIKKLKFWTVGSVTQKYLFKELCIDSKYSKVKTGIGALKELKKAGLDNILIISSDELRKDLSIFLNNSNLNYFQLSVYKKHIIESDLLIRKFNNLYDEFLVFTSPSTVDGFIYNTKCVDLLNIRSRCISIGPTTTEYIKQMKGDVFYEAKSPNIINLYAEINKIISKQIYEN